MKGKMKSLSLTYFVLILITISGLINTLRENSQKDSINNEVSNVVATYSESPHKKHKEDNKKLSDTLKLNKLQTTTSDIQPHKKERVEDFFKKTSKKNRNAAWQALGAFVCGILLFIGSIHLICWNERRAVKQTEYIDYIRDDRKCKVIEHGQSIDSKDIEHEKVYIVNGPVTIETEATIPDLPLNVTSNKGKIVVIKTNFEKYSKQHYEERKEVGEDEEGNTIIERKETERIVWNSYSPVSENRFSGKFYHGKVLINNNYYLNMSHLEREVENNQTLDYADNSYIYRPTPEDVTMLEEYFAKENNNPSVPYKIILHNQYVYILRDPLSLEQSTTAFDPKTFQFTESDVRFSIKFFYMKNDTYVTAVGKLQAEEDGKISLQKYKTPVAIPGCSYFCCLCTDSDSFYEVDLFYNQKMGREEIVNRLEEESTACTWGLRLLGFILHFLAFYLILYPLILLVGMIPFLGAVGATVLIFFAFLLALMSFLFIIACSWICARPILAFLIFGVIFILMFVVKSSKEHTDDEEYHKNMNTEQMKGKGNDKTWPHRKFL
jgi:hypothetical protein